MKDPIAVYCYPMPRYTLKPSGALATLLRARRDELGLSARDVAEQTAKLGERIPFPTLVKIERGEQEPGVRRFYALLKLYKVPLEIVPDLLELEELAVEPPGREDPESLYQRGLEHWRAGRVGEALGHLFALRHCVTTDPAGRLLRQKGLLSFSVMARNLDRLKLALQLVIDLLREGPDRSILPNVLIQGAAVWQELGSPDAALGFLARAEAIIAPDDHQRRGWVAAQKAGDLLALGQADEAILEVERAIRFLGSADLVGTAKLLQVKTRALVRRGCSLEEAEAAAEEALASARRAGQTNVIIGAEIARAAIQADLGRVDEAGAGLERALAEAISIGDRASQFRAHYYLWKVSRRTGDADRARVEFEAARYFARFVEEALPEVAEIRAVSDGGKVDETLPARKRRRKVDRS